MIQLTQSIHHFRGKLMSYLQQIVMELFTHAPWYMCKPSRQECFFLYIIECYVKWGGCTMYWKTFVIIKPERIYEKVICLLKV
jgi:hypothetical protein